MAEGWMTHNIGDVVSVQRARFSQLALTLRSEDGEAWKLEANLLAGGLFTSRATLHGTAAETRVQACQATAAALRELAELLDAVVHAEADDEPAQG